MHSLILSDRHIAYFVHGEKGVTTYVRHNVASLFYSTRYMESMNVSRARHRFHSSLSSRLWLFLSKRVAGEQPFYSVLMFFFYTRFKEWKRRVIYVCNWCTRSVWVCVRVQHRECHVHCVAGKEWLQRVILNSGMVVSELYMFFSTCYLIAFS